MKFSKRRNTALALALLVLGTQSASAISVNFNGNITKDDDYVFFTFTLGATGSVTLQTTSYLASGGFVPYLHVWDSTGFDLSGVEPVNGDASYTLPSLAAGSYFVGLTVANNKANGNNLPGGIPTPTIFDHNGLGDFTNIEFSCFGSGSFFTSSCDQRTSAWALGISGVVSASLYPDTTPTPTPEPSTLALGLAGAAALFARRRSNPIQAAAV